MAPALLAALLATIVLLVGRGVAQEKPTEDAVVEALDARAKRFLEAVSLGKSQAAYDELLAGSPLAGQTEALRQQVANTDRLESLLGRYRGFERIGSRRLGADLVLLRYLYKGERYPIVWHLAFYRTADAATPGGSPGQWRVVLIRFDMKFEALGP